MHHAEQEWTRLCSYTTALYVAYFGLDLWLTASSPAAAVIIIVAAATATAVNVLVIAAHMLYGKGCKHVHAAHHARRG